MKTDRLFQLLYLLLEKGSITGPEAAARLSVSVRTVYRDVETLSLSGIPVYTSAGKGGGISLLPGYALDQALLTDEEQNEILFAIQSLQATDRPVDALLDKLGGVFKKQNTGWIEVDFSRWGYGPVDRTRFQMLKNAILERQTLELLYCGMSGATARRRVCPVKLVFKDKNWYMQAYCLKAEGYRLFKVSRMIEIQPTGERFIQPDTPVPSIEYDTMVPVQWIDVALRFTPRMAFRVYDEFDRQSVQEQPDGSLRIDTRLPAGDWLSDYLLTFGTDLQVLAPESLRQTLHAMAQNIADHYQT